MAKRGAIVDMGRHKPLGSSWRSVDTAGYSRVYEPETRPEFRCYVHRTTGLQHRLHTSSVKQWLACQDDCRL